MTKIEIITTKLTVLNFCNKFNFNEKNVYILEVYVKLKNKYLLLKQEGFFIFLALLANIL